MQNLEMIISTVRNPRRQRLCTLVVITTVLNLQITAFAGVINSPDIGSSKAANTPSKVKKKKKRSRETSDTAVELTSPRAMALLKVIFPDFDPSNKSTGQPFKVKTASGEEAFGKELVTELGEKEAPYRKGLNAVYVFTESEQEAPVEETHGYYFLIDIEKQPPRVILRHELGSKGTGERKNCHGESWEGNTCQILFEFAPYWLKKGERALGFRLREESHAPMAYGENTIDETLVLFQLRDGAVSEVFHEPITTINQSSALDDKGTSVSTSETKFTVEVQKTMTDGVFDWALEGAEVTTQSHSGNKVTESRSEKKIRKLFTWKGERYVAK